MSLVAVLIMTVTLFAIGSVIFIVVGSNASLTEIKSKVDISVYFTVGAGGERCFGGSEVAPGITFSRESYLRFAGSSSSGF